MPPNQRETKIPNTIDRAFECCSGLTSITIPNSVTSIGEAAFYYCIGLTSVTIHDSVTEIGDDAFSGCERLKEVHISDLAAWYEIEFDDHDSNPLYYAQHLFMDGKEVTELKIPDSVTSIGDYAFERCSGLTSIDIPNSVTSIGERAFAYCYGLTSVTIGSSVTSIGDYAFGWCSNLKEVHFENPNGWKVAGKAISGLDDPATAAKYLTSGGYYRNYYWKREG